MTPDNRTPPGALFDALVELASSLPATEVIQTPDGPMTEAGVIAHLSGLELKYAREAAREEAARYGLPMIDDGPSDDPDEK